MKIVIPFDQSELYSVEDLQLLGQFGMSPAFVLDQALCDWTLYIYGQTTDMYENTVDIFYEAIHRHHQHDQLRMAQLEILLSENADDLCRMIAETAIFLKQVVHDIPDEFIRQNLNSDTYQYFKVEKIDVMGRFAVLTTESIDLFA